MVSELAAPAREAIAQQLYSLANICGPALGGVLLSLGPTARSHEEVALAFDALTFVSLLIRLPWLPCSRLAAAQHSGDPLKVRRELR